MARGGEKDEERARELFAEADAGGDLHGTTLLGEMFCDGLGGEKDEKRAKPHAPNKRSRKQQHDHQGACMKPISELC